MAVVDPLRVVIENYPEDQTEEFEVANNPEDAAAGSRRVPFSRVLFIERDDFMEDPPKKFFRLAPGREVRLRGAYFVTCTGVVKDATGEITELRCTYDPATRGGEPPDGRKVKATLHWVAAAHAIDAEVPALRPPVHRGAAGRRRRLPARPESRLARDAHRARSSRPPPPRRRATRYQFERIGYFCVDPDTRGRPAGVQSHRHAEGHLGEDRGPRLIPVVP